MNTDVEARLAQVFYAASQTELSKTYDAWATSYDVDMLATGYAHPAVICGLAARYVPDLAAPILDAGVGTGNIGQLLHILGFSNLHGIDMSQGMLERARERKVYAALHQAVLGEQLAIASGSFAAIISTGTFTLGHAPASAFDELTRILAPGGHVIFTVGDRVWLEAGFAAKLAELSKAALLKHVWESAPYQPMPHSKTESHFTARVQVYQRA